MITTSTESTLTEIVQELRAEQRDTLREFAEFLLAKQRRELAHQAAANGWPEGYFERTAGSIPDFPDRDSQEINPLLDDFVNDLRLDLPKQSS